MALGGSKRLSYDKLIKQVLDQFHQEFEMVKRIEEHQHTIMSQNEKILEMLRHIWSDAENLDRIASVESCASVGCGEPQE